jgi:phage replication initiation protein
VDEERVQPAAVLPKEEPPPVGPRTVIRGEIGELPWSYSDPDTGELFFVIPKRNKWESDRVVPLPKSGTLQSTALVDWVNCTLPWPDASRSLGDLFTPLLAILGRHFAPIEPLGRGLHGWTNGFALGESGAMFAVGGQRDTAFLSFSGQACSLIDGIEWMQLRALLEGEFFARITRGDLAVDDFVGTHSVDAAVDMYRANLFDAVGHPPTVNQHGDWLNPQGEGRTLEIGKRKNGKMLRVYEKGMQLGLRDHPWVRWEVELHNKDREIPWEIVTEPGRYFVGAYPKALSWAHAEMTRIRTNRATARTVYEHACEALSRQYGPLLSFMMAVEGSSEAVLSKVVRTQRPRRFSHPLYEDPAEVCK